MRRGLLLGSVIGLFNAGLAISLAWWFGRREGDFGFYSYTPMPRRYSDYLMPMSGTPGWKIALFLLSAFLVVNAVAVAAAVTIKSVWASKPKT